LIKLKNWIENPGCVEDLGDFINFGIAIFQLSPSNLIDFKDQGI
jgi:hypothetical protein